MLNVYDIRIDQSGTNASSTLVGNVVFDSNSAGRLVLETKNVKESASRLYYTDARVRNQIISYGTTAGFTSPITQGTNGLFHSGRTIGLGGTLSRNTSINLNNKDFKLMRGVTNSVDFSNSRLYASSGTLSIDYTLRQLKPNSSATNYDWGQNIIYQSSGTSGNFNTRVLYSKNQKASIDWSNRILSTSGVAVADWNNGNLKVNTLLRIPSTGTGIDIYNTVDQTVNYERLRLYKDSNIFRISSQANGSGTPRSLFISGPSGNLVIRNAAIVGAANFSAALSTGSTSIVGYTGSFTNSSGITNSLAILPTSNQTGTGGYRSLWISTYEQTLGSGIKFLIDAGLNSAADGSGTHISKFVVENTGAILATSSAISSTAGNFNTRILYARDQKQSIDWQNRQLKNSAGTVTFDWNASPDNTYFKQNGNNFGTHGYVGTTNNAQLIFKTNNTNRWSILENGNLFANGDYAIQATLNSTVKNIVLVNNSTNTVTFGNTTSNVQLVGPNVIATGATTLQIRNAAAVNATTYIPSTGNWNFNGTTDTGYKVNVTGSTRLQDVYLRRGIDYSSSGTFNNVPTTNTSNIRFTSNTPPVVSGFGQGSDGKVLYVSNTGTGQLVIANNSASSIAANRVLTGKGQNVTISSGAVVELIYDSTATVWRLNSGVVNNDISLSGDVAGSGSAGIVTTIQTNAVTTTKINNSAVTYAKIQNITANRILGRVGSTGQVQELALSSGLSFSGASIISSGGSSQWTTVSSTIYYGNNIGVGQGFPSVQASPTDAIHVDNGNNVSSALKFTAGSSTSNGTRVGIDGQGNGFFNVRDNQKFDILTNDTVRLSISSAGIINTPALAKNKLVSVNNSNNLTAIETTSGISFSGNTLIADYTNSPYKNVCRVTTTATLTATYSNGASGVGATLTNSGTLAAISIDGVSLALGDRVLVKNQSTGSQNGIYVVTTVGSGAVAWVLTRDADSNTANELYQAAVTVKEGTTFATTQWLNSNTSNAITIGSTSITYVISGAYTISTGLTLTNKTITVATGGVTRAMLANSTALSVIGRSANSAGAPADIAASSDGQVLKRVGSTVGFHAIGTNDINNGVITYAKLQSVTANRILGRITSTGAPQELAVSSGLAFSGASITTDSTVVTLTGTQTLTNKTITSGRFNQLLDTAGNISLLLSPVGSANYLTVFNGGAGASPKIVATGSDTNLNMQIESKGTGTVAFQIGSTYLMSLPTSAPSTNNVLQYNGSAYVWGAPVAAAAGSSGSMQFNNAGALGADSNIFWNNTSKTLLLGGGGFFSNSPLHLNGNTNNFLQTNIKNANAGGSASSDYVATADSGSQTANYIDMGINSSTYNDSSFTISGALDGYLYTNGGNLVLGTQSTKDIIFHTNGTLAANKRGMITSGGKWGVGNITPNTTLDINGDVAYRRGIDYSSSGTFNNVPTTNTSNIRFTNNTAPTVTGFGQGFDGKILTVMYVGTGTMIIANNSGSSLAANRVSSPTGNDIIVTSGMTVDFIYDSTASLWRPKTSGARILSGSTAIVEASWSANTNYSTTITVTGAAVNDRVVITITPSLMASINSASGGITLNAYVSSTNTVTVWARTTQFLSTTGGTWYVTVLK